jgi:hypothetical protein
MVNRSGCLSVRLADEVIVYEAADIAFDAAFDDHEWQLFSMVKKLRVASRELEPCEEIKFRLFRIRFLFAWLVISCFSLQMLNLRLVAQNSWLITSY